MANRNRDLTFSIVSEDDRFDVDRAARELEDLGRTARDAGDEFTDGARQADRALDDIATSARTSARKVDTSTDDMRRSLRGVGDEAGSTAREAAASFGSSGDIGDALQEVAANAPATLGPLGLAFGAVAGIGVGLFRAKTEALKERVGELVDAMIEAGGRLTKEFVDAEVLQLVKDGEAARLEDLVDRYKLIGVTTRDVIRARAGDAEAIERVDRALDFETKRRKASTDEMGRSEAAVAALRDGIGAGEDALRLAAEATADYEAATGDAATSVVADADEMDRRWKETRTNLERGIVAKVTVDAPTAAQLDAIRRGIVRGIGPVSVNAKVIPPPASALFYPGRYRP